ncbi:MAG: hypothetical protein WAK34_13335 [Rhodoplanes sp.]
MRAVDSLKLQAVESREVVPLIVIEIKNEPRGFQAYRFEFVEVRRHLVVNGSLPGPQIDDQIIADRIAVEGDNGAEVKLRSFARRGKFLFGGKIGGTRGKPLKFIDAKR